MTRHPRLKISLPPDDEEELRRIAKRRQMSISGLVRLAVAEMLEKSRGAAIRAHGIDTGTDNPDEIPR